MRWICGPLLRANAPLPSPIESLIKSGLLFAVPSTVLYSRPQLFIIIHERKSWLSLFFEALPSDADESFSFEVSGKMTSGNTPLSPTSIDPATEPIHGCQAESTFMVNCVDGARLCSSSRRKNRASHRKRKNVVKLACQPVGNEINEDSVSKRQLVVRRDEPRKCWNFTWRTSQE